MLQRYYGWYANRSRAAGAEVVGSRTAIEWCEPWPQRRLVTRVGTRRLPGNYVPCPRANITADLTASPGGPENFHPIHMVELAQPKPGDWCIE